MPPAPHPMPDTPALGAAGLAALEERLAHDLLTLNWRARPWLPEPGSPTSAKCCA